MDVSAAAPYFTSLTAAIPLVGSLFIGALALLVVWKLIRGAFA
jgi:hypothetical protein